MPKTTKSSMVRVSTKTAEIIKIIATQEGRTQVETLDNLVQNALESIVKQRELKNHVSREIENKLAQQGQLIFETLIRSQQIADLVVRLMGERMSNDEIQLITTSARTKIAQKYTKN